MDKDAHTAQNYAIFLMEELRNHELAAEYLLSAAENGSVEQFLLARRTVTKVDDGVALVADKTPFMRDRAYIRK